MSEIETLLSDAKPLCTDHQCPQCGRLDHVTVERVVVGNATLTLCHCRLCGHSWHPRLEPDPV
jgi:transcription elongation factor Elf1